ncbi:MAG: DUF3575 domain-containing protein, partial [Alistipes sp.]|nr:DUF3575 domain-containing protein [Candidatus Alistipes equi]
MRKERGISEIRLAIRGNASIDGYASKNIRLAQQRAKSLANYIISECEIEDSSVVILPREPLREEAIGILDTLSKSIEGINLEAIRDITHTVKGIHLKEAFVSIDGKWEGRNWNWYKTNVLEPTRFAEIHLYTRRRFVETQRIETFDMKVPSMLLASVPKIERTQLDEALVQQNAKETHQETLNKKSPVFVALKNNLLYDGLLVANLGLEVGFARHFSIDIPVTFSPYDISSDYKMRTLSFQPEFRYWFKEGWQGHFVGLNAMVSWYNVITPFNNRTRFQDRNGDTPLLGVGLSYGYSMPLGKKKNWGMEFTVGVGYAHLDYDMFYNVKNGAWFSRET